MPLSMLAGRHSWAIQSSPVAGALHAHSMHLPASQAASEPPTSGAEAEAEAGASAHEQADQPVSPAVLTSEATAEAADLAEEADALAARQGSPEPALVPVEHRTTRSRSKRMSMEASPSVSAATQGSLKTRSQGKAAMPKPPAGRKRSATPAFPPVAPAASASAPADTQAAPVVSKKKRRSGSAASDSQQPVVPRRSQRLSTDGVDLGTVGSRVSAQDQILEPEAEPEAVAEAAEISAVMPTDAAAVNELVGAQPIDVIADKAVEATAQAASHDIDMPAIDNPIQQEDATGVAAAAAPAEAADSASRLQALSHALQPDKHVTQLAEPVAQTDPLTAASFQKGRDNDVEATDADNDQSAAKSAAVEVVVNAQAASNEDAVRVEAGNCRAEAQLAGAETEGVAGPTAHTTPAAVGNDADTASGPAMGTAPAPAPSMTAGDATPAAVFAELASPSVALDSIKPSAVTEASAAAAAIAAKSAAAEAAAAADSTRPPKAAAPTEQTAAAAAVDDDTVGRAKPNAVSGKPSITQAAAVPTVLAKAPVIAKASGTTRIGLPNRSVTLGRGILGGSLVKSGSTHIGPGPSRGLTSAFPAKGLQSQPSNVTEPKQSNSAGSGGEHYSIVARHMFCSLMGTSVLWSSCAAEAGKAVMTNAIECCSVTCQSLSLQEEARVIASFTIYMPACANRLQSNIEQLPMCVHCLS